MSEVVAQASFNSGEWAPSLYARVDLQKYRAGAALLENFFIDYRGGASTRPGTKYVIQAYLSDFPVRVIQFQASFNVGYALEFGNFYMRPMFQGSPVLESPFAISGATQANPCVITVTGNNYAIGDWIFIDDTIVGMTQLAGRYFSISNVTGSAVTLADLNGVAIDSTGYGAYVSGGNAARIYVVPSPFAAADLQLLKFAQNIDSMVITHPEYTPQLLTLNGPTSWAFTPLTIGATIAPPTGVSVSTTLSAGSSPGTNYSYVVTSIDQNGQESNASIPAGLLDKQDIRSTAGTNQISWTAAPGAVAYNVYEANVSYFGAVPAGVQYGFIGTCKGTSFIDDNIGPDFSQTPPISTNPFIGGSILTTDVTAPGTYTTIPTWALSGGSPTVAGAVASVMQMQSWTLTFSGTGYHVGQAVQFPNGVVLIVATTSSGSVTSFQPLTYPGSSPGSITEGTLPSVMNSVSPGTITIHPVWGVGLLTITNPGLGYASAPTLAASSGAATATCTVSALGGTNPSVPTFFQQRLVFGNTDTAPQTFWMSKPGQYYNFDISNPSEAGDAITGTLVSGVLNSVKSFVSSAAGLLVATDKGFWMVNGGSAGSAVTPSSIVANAQAQVGANDVPPIVANYDVLYIQSKGSGVRDLAFNIYFSIFTGTDISILSSHLFFGYEILQWAWAELPFYVVWAVRNDGAMLTLTFLKEQEFVGWSHQVTEGSFNSVCVVTEQTADAGNVDAVYTVVGRSVNGNAVQYIERVAERIFPNGASSAWTVDAGIQYVGAPATSFMGAEHLAGLTVTGLADGMVIPPFTMPVNGEFTLGTAASTVTVGIGFTCQLQTLALDLGEPSVQGKVKKINAADVRVADTLGLSIGPDFDHLVPMKDLIVGNVSSMLTGQESQVVSDLVTGDARTFLGPAWTVPGQYCIEQAQPLPASVLGVFPLITMGDSK